MEEDFMALGERGWGRKVKNGLKESNVGCVMWILSLFQEDLPKDGVSVFFAERCLRDPQSKRKPFVIERAACIYSFDRESELFLCLVSKDGT